jgi:hypothetical protein
MSALPLSMPGLSVGPVPINHASVTPISTKRVASRHVPILDGSVSRAPARPTTTPGDWHLTDRGIAVIMVIAAMILTAALVVIGLTVVRVTSTDYGADLREPGQAQR